LLVIITIFSFEVLAEIGVDRTLDEAAEQIQKAFQGSPQMFQAIKVFSKSWVQRSQDLVILVVTVKL
jgi:hypothetical protein